MKSILIKGIKFIIQSYLKDDFVNLCCDDKYNIDSIRICFDNKSFSSWGKQSKKWKEFVSEIDVNKVKKQLDIIMNNK